MLTATYMCILIIHIGSKHANCSEQIRNISTIMIIYRPTEGGGGGGGGGGGEGGGGVGETRVYLKQGEQNKMCAFLKM